MGYNPNISNLQVGDDPFTHHLLASWRIQVVKTGYTLLPGSLTVHPGKFAFPQGRDGLKENMILQSKLLNLRGVSETNILYPTQTGKGTSSSKVPNGAMSVGGRVHWTGS